MVPAIRTVFRQGFVQYETHAVTAFEPHSRKTPPLERQAGVAPLAFGSLPHLQDAVAVVGYPIGGDTISVTSGRVA